MSDPSSTTAPTKAVATRRATAPTKAVATRRAAAAPTKAAASRPAAAAPTQRGAAKRGAAKRGAAKRQPVVAPARRAAAKRPDQSTPASAEQAVERGVVVATSTAPTRARRKLSGHLPPPAPQVTLPVTGWTFVLPPRREWPWIGGVVLVAALDIIDWPVALIIAIGHTILTNSHNEQLRELADGIEAAL